MKNQGRPLLLYNNVAKSDVKSIQVELGRWQNMSKNRKSVMKLKPKDSHRYKRSIRREKREEETMRNKMRGGKKREACSICYLNQAEMYTYLLTETIVIVAYLCSISPYSELVPQPPQKYKKMFANSVKNLFFLICYQFLKANNAPFLLNTLFIHKDTIEQIKPAYSALYML